MSANAQQWISPRHFNYKTVCNFSLKSIGMPFSWKTQTHLLMSTFRKAHAQRSRDWLRIHSSIDHDKVYWRWKNESKQSNKSLTSVGKGSPFVFQLVQIIQLFLMCWNLKWEYQELCEYQTLSSHEDNLAQAATGFPFCHLQAVINDFLNELWKNHHTLFWCN